MLQDLREVKNDKWRSENFILISKLFNQIDKEVIKGLRDIKDG